MPFQFPKRRPSDQVNKTTQYKPSQAADKSPGIRARAKPLRCREKYVSFETMPALSNYNNNK